MNYWTIISEGDGWVRLRFTWKWYGNKNHKFEIVAYQNIEDVVRVASNNATLTQNKACVYWLKNGLYSYDYFDQPFTGGHTAVYIDEHGDGYGYDPVLSKSRLVCSAVRLPSLNKKGINLDLLGILC